LKTPHTEESFQSHIKRSPTGNSLTMFVNMHQTPEERRDKYNMAREYGISWPIAQHLRDFRWTKFDLFIQCYLTPGTQLRFRGFARTLETSDSNN